MSRTSSVIMTAADKKAASADLKAQIKSIDTQIKDLTKNRNNLQKQLDKVAPPKKAVNPRPSVASVSLAAA